MIVDGLQITDESPLQRKLMDPTKRGTTFPGSPSDNDVYELTQSYLGNGPGIYFYSLADSKWVVKYPDGNVMPYDVAGATFGTMNDSDVIARHMAVRSYRLAEGFQSCVSGAKAAAIVDTSISIIRENRQGAESVLGTLFYEAAETVGVFSQNGSGDMIITAGETLILRAPDPADTDLADLAFTFAGTLL